MSEIFWSPGVLTQIQNPERVTSKKCWGWGLEIKQPADKKKNADNWFHIGIPSKSRTHFVGGTPVEKLILRAKVNKNATIKAIHLRDGENLIVEHIVDFNNTDVFANFKVPKKYEWIAFASNASGIAVCVRVEFSAGPPTGSVIFLGAAVQLDCSK